MHSKPYKHGEYWRIDANENSRKYYIEFESPEEANEYLKELKKSALFYLAFKCVLTAFCFMCDFILR